METVVDLYDLTTFRFADGSERNDDAASIMQRKEMSKHCLNIARIALDVTRLWHCETSSRPVILHIDDSEVYRKLRTIDKRIFTPYTNKKSKGYKNSLDTFTYATGDRNGSQPSQNHIWPLYIRRKICQS